MFHRKKKKETEEALALLFRERIERVDGHGAPPNGHVMSESGDELAERESTEELRDLLDEETGKTQEGQRSFNVAGNNEVRPETADEAADKLNTIWRQRLDDDPEGALEDVQARAKKLGYLLAYAGHTFGAPLTKRTYYIMDPDQRLPLDVFHNGDVDLTLLEVCVWSDVAFKRWKNS
jgi:hypothetical protein